MNPGRTTLISMMCLILGTASAGGQQKPAEPDAGLDRIERPGEPSLQAHNPRYQLRVGDTFEISFRFTPDFNQTVTVQPDGFINLRELADLHVAGKTTPDLTEVLQKNYSRILHDPVITIVLKDFEKPYFIAQGELGHPGKYELRGDTTVLEAIGIAGGLTEKAKHSQVLLFRRVSDQWTSVKELNVKEMLASQNLTEDLHLRPGDMIYVPKSALSKIRAFIPTSNVGVYAPTR